MGGVQLEQCYKPRELMIEKVSGGGYIVWPIVNHNGFIREPLFASGYLKEALDYIKDANEEALVVQNKLAAAGRHRWA